MKKLLVVAAAVCMFQAVPAAHAADVYFNINVGGPPVVITQPPDFLYPPELGVGVAVGVPYDLFYDNGVYYLYRNGWYRTSYYGGGWVRVHRRDLPPELRRYRISQIHSYRDREYRTYMRERDHYHGHHFRPEGRRDDHRDMRGPGRGEHRDNRDMRERGHYEHGHDNRGGEHGGRR